MPSPSRVACSPSAELFPCRAELLVFLQLSHLASFSSSQAILSHQAYFWIFTYFFDQLGVVLNKFS
ncbi:hypothetical protein IC582_001108 [Cucumis melo]